MPNMRLLRECASMAKLPPNSEIGAEPVENDMHHWKGYIKGPKDTPYEGGTFLIDIKLPADYPFTPPHMKFITRVWHPNVSSQTGYICLDILNKEWTPALTVRTALLSLQALLSAPNVDDPQDGVVAAQMRTAPELFKRTAREWAIEYAGAPSGKQAQSSTASAPAAPAAPPFVYPDQLKTLMEMGIDESTARAALLKNKGSLETTVNSLFS